jgi:hypothetical protein
VKNQEQLRLSLNDNLATVLVFIDLRKAFDTVDHVLLLLNNLITQTIQLLSNRSCPYEKLLGKSAVQRLGWNNFSIPQYVMHIGVLGPLLFLMFINHLCALGLHSKQTLFADISTINHGKFFEIKVLNPCDYNNQMHILESVGIAPLLVRLFNHFCLVVFDTTSNDAQS